MSKATKKKSSSRNAMNMKHGRYNSMTMVLLGVLTMMLVGTTYLMTLPRPAINIVSGKDFQTDTYRNASSDEREQLEVAREDFEALNYELRLINVDFDKIMLIVDGKKLKVVSSKAYLKLMLESLDEDESPFYYIFLSYFMASQFIPAGNIELILDSNGVYYNGASYPRSLSLFRRLCTILARKI